jgi:hypothetical protein
MPSIPRVGKVTTAFDFDVALRDQLFAFAAQRGSTVTHEIHVAIRRHLAHPPPREQDAPLPGTPRPRKRPPKKS